LIALTEGVKAGEQVITTGQGKLRPGSPISVNNKVVPASSANPKPQES
jgi:membrane fusion protein (multidrug efflux system)